MPKAKRNIGQEILEGIRQLKRGEHGRVMKVPSVTTIREKTGLSQPRFAELLGVSVRTLQEWEQGRRAPSGAARTLLLIAEAGGDEHKIARGIGLGGQLKPSFGCPLRGSAAITDHAFVAPVRLALPSRASPRLSGLPL